MHAMKRLFLIPCALALAACNKPPTPENPDPAAKDANIVNLEQGWSREVQQRAWFGSFGSHLVPTAWLEHLQWKGQPFMSDAHMDALGFLTELPSAANPQSFPVGFTQTQDGDGQAWTGLGCAACHTGEVRYQGKRMRLDGGQGVIDFNAFESDLIASLKAVQSDSFGGFADALGAAPGDRPALQKQLGALIESLVSRHAMNAVDVAYGHGRLDAFGQIFNAVAVDFLGLAQNRRAPDAPVSFPVLWDAPHLDVVQWNGSAPNAGPGPLLQNITTAMAVYGSLDIAKRAGVDGYASSVDFTHLDRIEDDLYALKSPQWPEAILGTLDRQRVQRGAHIYAEACVSCHALSDRNDPKRELKTVITPVDEVGTDPRMADNFLASKSTSGAFEGKKVGVLFGPELSADAQTSDLVIHAAVGAALGHPLASVRDAVGSFHRVLKTPADQPRRGYKARPLSGIWASAPYLHNGSIPSLVELLKAPGERVTAFAVGNREFDPATVGLAASSAAAGSSTFDVSLPGNSNSGHTYGTGLDADSKRDLLEYLKSL